MIVVIQCAGGKNPCAGRFKTEDGRPILFVADPGRAPADDKEVVYKRPDDPAKSGRSYREELVEYNHEYKSDPAGGPYGLLPAYKLYTPRYDLHIYTELFEKFGIQGIFVLSAGWGLITSDFLTPAYDITFSNNLKNDDAYKKRTLKGFKDQSMLAKRSTGPIVLLSSKNYVPLFRCLTESVKAERIVFWEVLIIDFLGYVSSIAAFIFRRQV